LTRFRDYYAILGVPRDATQEQIKEAYRRLVKIYHPDRNPFPEAEEMFKLINEAYHVLSDPAKRAEYNVLYDAVMAKTSAHTVAEMREGISRSGAHETYAAQETEELTEAERALVAFCKTILAYLLGSIRYEDLIALANDYVKTLKSAWGSAVRPEVRRLAMEAADLAEEREELRLVTLFVKLFLAEASPLSEKLYGTGRRSIVVGAATVRRPSEVYKDLDKLLSSAQRRGYQGHVSAAGHTESEMETSDVYSSSAARESYVLVELPKKIRILGGLGSLLMYPLLLVLLIMLPYMWVLAEDDPLLSILRSTILHNILPMVIPLWLLGFAMTVAAFHYISKMLVTKPAASNSMFPLSPVPFVFFFELFASMPGAVIITLPKSSDALVGAIVIWFVMLMMTFGFGSDCMRLSDLVKFRKLRVVGYLHVLGVLLSIVLIGIVALLIAYVLQAVAFFSLPSTLYIRISENTHVSQPHDSNRRENNKK
jgi:DnaJ-domain-containing protein 1